TRVDDDEPGVVAGSGEDQGAGPVLAQGTERARLGDVAGEGQGRAGGHADRGVGLDLDAAGEDVVAVDVDDLVVGPRIGAGILSDQGLGGGYGAPARELDGAAVPGGDGRARCREAEGIVIGGADIAAGDDEVPLPGVVAGQDGAARRAVAD